MKTFDEVYATLPDGWLTEPEARVLWEYARRTEGPILEVGCYKGRSTVLLASLGRPVYCVDPFAGFDDGDPTGLKTKEAFVSNMIRRGHVISFHQALEGHEDIILCPKRVEEWKARPVGFAYLDGDHTYEGTHDQIGKAWECNPKVIAVHDVNDSGGGLDVKRACLELLGPWSHREGRLAVWER